MTTAQDQQSRELLPCPFCGQQDAFVEQLDTDASVVICDARISEHCACLARGPVAVRDDEDEMQPGRTAAIAAWNRRAPVEPGAHALPARGVDPMLDTPAGLEPVATIASIDEHGPCFGWHQHWANFPVGTKLYTAAQVQAMGRVPPGWQAVPVEPTIAMLIAGDMPRISTEQTTKNHAAYAAMLAAAPRPPAAQERKPLTDEQIDDLEFDAQGLPNSHLEFARAIEAAHGIT